LITRLDLKRSLAFEGTISSLFVRKGLLALPKGLACAVEFGRSAASISISEEYKKAT